MQRQLEVGAVALVGLDDEPLAAGPLGTGAHVVHVAADHEARPQAGLGEDQHQHRRRRGLAVRAGDRQRLGAGADRRQHAGPAQRRDAELARLVELVEVVGDRGRRRDRVAAEHVRAVVADVHGDAGRPQAVEHRALAEVDPGHVVAHLGQRQRDRAHPRPADTDHVQPAGLRQVERRDWHTGVRARGAAEVGVDAVITTGPGYGRHLRRAADANRHRRLDGAVLSRAVRPTRPAGQRAGDAPPQLGRVGRQRRQLVRVGSKPLDRRRQLADLGLAQQHRRRRVGEPAHVGRLVVLGRRRPRHEDRRRARDRDLVHRAGPAAPDQQVGAPRTRAACAARSRPAGSAHRRSPSRRGPASCEEARRRRAWRIASARSSATSGEQLDDRLVEHARSLRAAHHGDDEAVVGQTERRRAPTSGRGRGRRRAPPAGPGHR